jgi:hypothetical protein
VLGGGELSDNDAGFNSDAGFDNDAGLDSGPVTRGSVFPASARVKL